MAETTLDAVVVDVVDAVLVVVAFVVVVEETVDAFVDVVKVVPVVVAFAEVAVVVAAKYLSFKSFGGFAIAIRSAYLYLVCTGSSMDCTRYRRIQQCTWKVSLHA